MKIETTTLLSETNTRCVLGTFVPPKSLLDLPLELVELIISAIEDLKTLCALALVNKALSKVVTVEHLFYRVPFLAAEGVPSYILWDHLALHGARTANVRALRVLSDTSTDYLKAPTPPTNPNASVLKAASHMRSLKKIVWRVAGDPWNGLLETLCTSCPDLQDVHLIVWNGYAGEPSRGHVSILKEWLPVLSLSNLVVFRMMLKTNGVVGASTEMLSFTEAMIVMLRDRCPNLRTLGVEQNDRRELECILEGHWPQLEDVWLAFSTNAEVPSLPTFFQAHPFLQHIYISGPEHIAVKLSHIPRVRTLKVPTTWQLISGDGSGCRSLEYVADFVLNNWTPCDLNRLAPNLKAISGELHPSLLEYDGIFASVERLGVQILFSSAESHSYLAFFPALRVLLWDAWGREGQNNRWTSTEADAFLDHVITFYPSLEYAEVTVVDYALMRTRMEDGSWEHQTQPCGLGAYSLSPNEWSLDRWHLLYGGGSWLF